MEFFFYYHNFISLFLKSSILNPDSSWIEIPYKIRKTHLEQEKETRTRDPKKRHLGFGVCVSLSLSLPFLYAAVLGYPRPSPFTDQIWIRDCGCLNLELIFGALVRAPFLHRMRPSEARLVWYLRSCCVLIWAL